LEIPEPNLQLTFYHRLIEVRETYLLDALLSLVAELEIAQLDRELSQFVSNAALQRVAGWGLRGEIIFAVPYVLSTSPELLDYYRLLLGFSQNQFYRARYGFAPLKPLEERGRLSRNNMAILPDLCHALCASSSIVETTVVSSTDRFIEIRNAAGRTVRVEFANDPDICIREGLPSGRFRNLVAIEIKGGRDLSNIHNRIGEAEKSHQKAKKEGYVECWTMVGVVDLNVDLARRESPTTDRFYHIDQITDAQSYEFEDFRENLLSRVGISG
jgi:hypothetical protein